MTPVCKEHAQLGQKALWLSLLHAARATNFHTSFVCLFRAWSMRTRDTACSLGSIGHCQPMFLVHVLVRYTRSIQAGFVRKVQPVVDLVLSGLWVTVNPCSLYTWYTSPNGLSLRYSKY